MKKIYLLLLLCCWSVVSYAIRVYAPNTNNAMSATATYCQSASASAITYTYNTCNSGTGTTSGVTITRRWYYNTTNTTSGGTLVDSTVATTPTAGTGTATYTPSTAATGSRYYFCRITWTGAGTCRTSGIVTSATCLITVTTAPPTISGATSVCTGVTTTLANAVTGGTWTSSNTTRASINPTTGLVYGRAAGAVTITYATGCAPNRTLSFTVLASPAAIGGATTVCTGTTATVTNATAGGTWSSSNPAVASITSAGVVRGNSGGAVTITYTVGSCFATRAFTVYQTPTSITGATSICGTATTTLANSVAGGTWTRTNGTGTLTINATTGVVTGGATAGTATISYTTGTSCRVTRSMTVLSTPANITGTPTTICAGATTTYASTTSGLVWSSSNNTIASVSAGTVLGRAAGSATISYTNTGTGCFKTRAVTVRTQPGAISGASAACVGVPVTFTNATPGGTWARTNGTGTGTIVSATGVFTGATAGGVTISYNISGCRATQAFTVSTTPAAIAGASRVCIAATTTLTNSVGGGTWTSSSPAIASITTGGVLRGNSAGVTNISYTIGSCAVGKIDTSVATPGTSTGTTPLCAGTTAVYANPSAHGTWTSANTTIASVNPITGLVAALTAGTANISYSTGCGTAASRTLTVAGTLAAIAGAATVCSLSTTTFTNATGGGTWSSSAPAIASITSGGVIRGNAQGIATITYTNGGCAVTKLITVLSTPGSITGGSSLCVGLRDTLLNAALNGTWTSSNTAIASISSDSGVVHSLSAGTTTISYSTGCGTATSLTYTVNTTPTAITGMDSLCVGVPATLGNTVGSGTWSSSNTSIATITSGTGVVTGRAAGNAIITYTIGSCSDTFPVLVSASPAAISGTIPVCTGLSTALTNSVSGGLWSASDTLLADVDPFVGNVTVLAPGVVAISYTLGYCAVSISDTIFAQPDTIAGFTPVCEYGAITLSNAVAGGTWSSTNPSIATINASTGAVYGVATGATLISYTIGTCFDTGLLNVTIGPAPITGPTTVCVGATVALDDTVLGGDWSTSDASIASVDPSGIVYGVASGIANITYTIGSCFVVSAITVYNQPAAISGVSVLCEGSSSTLTNSVSGGVWTSTDPLIASINGSTGSARGVAQGDVDITYSIGTCYATAPLTINPLPRISLITGISTFCVGDISTMTNDTSGGTWASSNTSIASIDATSGDAYGVANGTSIISYSLTNSCATVTDTTLVTILALPVPTFIAPPSNTCVGSSATYTTQSGQTGYTWSVPGTAGVDYNITAGGIGTGNNTVTLTWLTTGSKNVTVSYTSPAGCDAASPAINTITVNPIPTVTATPAATAICRGTTTTITASGATTYTWAPAAGLSASTGATVTFSGTTTATYTVTGTTTGCTDTAIRTITVNAVPSVTATPVASTICSGSNTNITATGATTYSWAPATGLSATTGATVNFSGTSTTTFTVTGTTTGCTDTAVRTITVVAGVPTVSISGTTTANVGSTSTLTGTPSGGTWSSSAATIASVVAATGVVRGNLAGVAIISYTSTNICGSATDTASFTVAPATGTISGTQWTGSGNSTNTTADPSNFSTVPAATTPGSSAINVSQWRRRGTTGSSATSCYSSAGWSTAASVDTTETIYFSITNNATTEARITAVTIQGQRNAQGPTRADVYYCYGTSGPNVRFGTTTATITTSSASHAFTGSMCINPGQTATFKVCGYSAGNTSGTFRIENNTGVTMTYALGVTAFAAATPSSNTPVCSGNDINFTGGAASNGVSPYSYSWSGPTAFASTLQSPTRSAAATTATGTYTYIATDDFGCADTSTTAVVVNATPTVTATPVAATICHGSNTNMTASGATTYSWAPATGLSSTTGATVNFNGASTTTYTVTGTTTGCSGTATQTITVNPIPTVTVTPASSTICRGTNTTMTASGATTYTWSPATGLSATTGATVTFSGTATATYTVTGTTTGCSSTATQTITVTPIPTVTVTPVSSTICRGSTTNMTASGATTYTWSPATGLSATTGATVTFSGTTTATYTVTGITLGCSATASQTITVNPTPTVTATPVSAVICTGSSTNITASGATTYTWSPSTGLSASTGAIVTFSGLTTSTYTVTGTSLGCSGTASQTITVNPIPTVTVTPVSSTICRGSTTNMTASGATTYTWSPAAGLSATTGATVTFSGTTTATYTVTGTTLGCSATASQTITVNPIPTVTVTPVSSTICSGTTTNMTASGATTYTWSPSTGLSASTGATVTFSGLTTSTYTVTGTSLGCSGTATQTITVNPVPTVTVTPVSATICRGNTTNMTASGATTYTWAPSTGLSASTGATVTFSGTTTATYTVTGTSLGCSGTATQAITVNPVPTVTVTPVASTICSGTTTNMTSSGATTYTWSPATGLSATTGATVTFSGTTTATYTVTGTTTGCSATASQTITVNPTPTVTVTPVAASICRGNTTNMTASGATSYTWSPAIGLSATTGATVTFSGTAIATYTVTGTTTGCGGTASQTITVTPIPTVTATPVASTICRGSNTNINATGATTYSWVPATGLSATTGATVVAAPTVTTTYTVTGISGASCTGTTTVTINVTALPLVPAPIVGAGYLCTGNTALFTDSVSGGTWATSNAAIASINSGGNVVAITAGTVLVSYTIANSCGTNTDTALLQVLNTPSANISSAVVPCFGYGTSVVFSGTAGDTISYDVDGGAATNAVLTVGSFTIAIPSLTAMRTYHLISVRNRACNTTIDTTVVLNPAQMTWTGASDTDWNNAANWSCGSVPLATDNVTIPYGMPRYPTLSATATGAANNIVIDTAITVTLDSASALSIKGSFTNHGKVVGLGRVVLNGTALQAIRGFGRTSGLELNNTAGAFIDTPARLSISRVLSIANGTLTTNDSLLLYADTIGSANVAPIAPGSAIVGRARVLQNVQGGYRRYRFICHPFVDTIPLSQLQNYMDITGTGGAANGFTTTATNSPSAFRYNTLRGNSTLSYDPGWRPFTSALPTAGDTNKIARYQGVRLFMRGAKGEGLGYGSYRPSPTVIGQWGNLNQGRLVIPLIKGDSTQDYNFIGNPYASPVDIGTVLYQAKIDSNIIGSFYIWNPTLGAGGQFTSFPISTVSATPFYIAANTSFEVRARHNGDSIVFNEANKGAMPTNSLLRTLPEYTLLTIYDGNYHPWDMLHIKFDDNTTDAQDQVNDGDKLIGGELNFYSLSSDNRRQSIDVRPYGADKVIPLGITSNYAQEFIIRAETLVLPENGSIFLHDKWLSTYTALTAGAEYRFQITKDAASQGNNRFELSMKPGNTALTSGLSVSMSPNPANGEVSLAFAAGSKATSTVSLTDINGVVVYTTTIAEAMSGAVTIPLHKLASGIYHVAFTHGDNKVVKRLVKE